MIPIADIPYSMIAVSGNDAQEFLQGQLTNDILLLSKRDRLLAAWCNAKGRVICLMRVVPIKDGYGLIVPSELTDELVRRLTMYRFRSQVEFSVEAVTAAQIDADDFASAHELLAARLRSGVAEIWRAQSEKFTPHMLNLDLLDAISLDKGCYTGQEVVARTHYRGASKRRCLRFRSAEPVSPGDKVSDGQRDVGEVVNAIGDDLLAVILLDNADDALTVNGVALEHVPLPYL